MGGRINLISKEGEGTTITFSIKEKNSMTIGELFEGHNKYFEKDSNQNANSINNLRYKSRNIDCFNDNQAFLDH